jgi:UDP-glucuronate decarboxylase
MHSIIKDDVGHIVGRLAPDAAELAGKTILLVGGMGFLGQNFRLIFDHLNRTVLSTPCRIIAIDSMITSTGTGALEDSDNHFFLRHDIREQIQLDEKIDYVIHCAGVASPYYYRQFPVETIEVATLGTKNTLEIARKHGARILYFSSSEIYGDPTPDAIPTKEEYKGNVSCHGPRACYDESKRMGETMCYIYSEYFDTHTSIVRPFNIYGPGMRESDYRVLPNFASAVKAGKPLPIYSTGRQTRTYCYLVDAMVGFTLALLKGHNGEPYNIGNPTPEISVNELADIIERVADRPVKRKLLEYPETYPGDEPQRRCPDISKAKAHLGYEPKVDLEAGLARFFSWTNDTYKGVQAA